MFTTDELPKMSTSSPQLRGNQIVLFVASKCDLYWTMYLKLCDSKDFKIK